MRTEQRAESHSISRRDAPMKSVRSALTKRRHIPTCEVTPHNENRTVTGMEELYWFAMALTGDPDLAAQLERFENCCTRMGGARLPGVQKTPTIVSMRFSA